MYPEACHDYWGGKPLYPINKTHSNSCISNIMTHLASKWVKNSLNHLKFAWNAWNGSFKGQNILSICFPFLGGLSLHLNHLIGSRVTNYDWPFGTLPLGLFWSNLDTMDLETYPRTYSDHF